MKMPKQAAQTYKIAIIGGGASAVLLLNHLADLIAAHSCSIDVYDRSGRFARGIAYSTRRDCHLLNVRAEDLSAHASHPSDFSDWAKDFGYAKGDFVPRRRYGDYLESLLTKAQGIMDVNLLRQDVVKSVQDRDGYALSLASGDTAHYDFVVLASGNVRPLGCKTQGNVPGYFADPWSLDEKFLQSAQHIALIGAGLTAVDALLSLNDMNYQGKVSIISRRTLLPAVHSAPAAWHHTNKAPANASPLGLLREIRQEAKAAAAQNIAWQAVIDSRRNIINALWSGFSKSQRAQFMRHLYTFWGVHRHRMAPEVANIVASYKDQSRLDFIKSRVAMIETSPRQNLRLHFNDGSDKDFDAAINCMGYRYDEPGRDYEVSARLGPAQFGDMFETTAIPEIRAQSFDLAKKIANAHLSRKGD